jgi:protoheme ferro-lyase
MLLSERGIPDDKVRIAWADWGEPDITSSVRHLAALGCDRILTVPAVYPLDTVATRLDLEVSVRQARVSDSVVATTLSPWRDDEALIEELRSRVLTALEPVH